MATTTIARNRRNRDRLGSPITMSFMYVFLALFALVSAFPFYYMLVTSTYRTKDILVIPPPIWFGSSWMENYTQLLEKGVCRTFGPRSRTACRLHRCTPLQCFSSAP